MRRWILQNATVGLAASREAALALFGSAWEADPRLRLLYYGIDLKPFQVAADPVTTRAELGIPADAFVMGHVGRFWEQKNHEFLVHIASEVAKREPNARLLLVGTGPLRPAIEKWVVRAGIKDRTIFAGMRPEVPRLMLGAMDVFVLPSLHEGLPLVGIEAQAAGLPFIVSDVVSGEMDVLHSLIQRLSLSQPASVWADAILAARNTLPSITQREALRLMEKSRCNIYSSVRELEGVYANEH
jgi:glycosyltransferase involved in cell wall biosynthesis